MINERSKDENARWEYASEMSKSCAMYGLPVENAKVLHRHKYLAAYSIVDINMVMETKVWTEHGIKVSHIEKLLMYFWALRSLID